MNANGQEMGPVRRAATVALTGAVALCASGCAARFDPPVDAASPLAPQIAAVVAANRTYPQWRDFPRRTVDEWSPVVVAQEINTLRVAGGALAGEAARIDWTLSDAEDFAAQAAARAADAPAFVEPAASAEAVEAFARRARDRGRAPPAIPRT